MEWLMKLVPTVATALGGPLAGLAAEAVADALGMSDKSVSTVKEALTQGSLSAEQITKLKEAELALKKIEKEQQFSFAELDVKNTQGARDMQMSTNSKVPAILAVIVVSGFFGILVSMMLGWLKVSDQQALLLLLGSLSTAFGSVLNFYFGSSHGSRIKTEALANSQPAK